MDIHTRTLTRLASVIIGGLAVVLAACGAAEVDDLRPAASPDQEGQAEDDADGTEPDGAGVEQDDSEEATGRADETDTSEAADETDASEAADGPEPTEAAAAGGTPAEDQDCSAQGATLKVRSMDAMPAEVAAARDFLLDAAVRCDEQLLYTAIEESEMFTYSFGSSGDAMGYWWELEEAGEAPFLRLAQVLATTPSTLEDGALWVWPQVHTGRAEDTTDAAWAELTWLDDPAATRAAEDGYLDWRVGITADGQWRFFVAGD